MRVAQRLCAGFSARYAAALLSAALLAFEGFNSFGLGAPVTGWGAVRVVVDVALGLALAVLAACDLRLPPGARDVYRRVRPLALGGALLLLFAAGLAFFNATRLILFTAPAHYYVTDVIAFTDECARLTLAGRNPYDPNGALPGFVEALRRFPLVVPTPLRGGALGPGPAYPSRTAIADAEQVYLAGWMCPIPPRLALTFDPGTLTSYPALSFLLYAPLVWAGLPDILLLNWLVVLALGVWLVAQAPRGDRRWTALALGAALPLLLYSLIADTEVVALAFILIAWRYRERRWVSAVALGLGCAFRQYCWLFAPFILFDALLTVAERDGWRAGLREAAWRSMIALGAFMLPNLPFALANPSAWWTGLWLPVMEPLFPLGVGLVALTHGGVAPWAPATVYTALEVVALGVSLWALWRWRSVLREAAPLLALIPLFFAWRSLPNYFTIAPLLALYAATALRRERSCAAMSSPLSVATA